MKIVDEKGKLFGKLNVIDFLAIVVLIAAVIFVAVRFLLPKEGDSMGATTKLTYTVQVNGIDQPTYEEVMRHMAANEGRDQLMANGEMVDAYVTNVEATPHVNYATDAQGAVVRTVEDYADGRLDLTFTIEANVDNPTVNKVGTQEVRVGKSHIVKTVHFEFTYGTIMTCDWA